MKIVVSGGTGFVGRALVDRLVDERHTVILLTRNSSYRVPAEDSSPIVVRWDAKTIGEWASSVDGADAIINLAGESIAGGRWTRARKIRILESRIDATRALVGAIAQARRKPSVLVNASAVGYYGHVESGDVTESHAKGRGFLADVVEGWEMEAREAEKFGVRAVFLRLGVVLGDGGALEKIVLPFRLFAGGWFGSGRQWFPWVHIEDVVGAVLFGLHTEQLFGPVNVVSPHSTTMKEFSRTLAAVLHRPCWLPVPGFALRTALGKMAETLLTGQRVIPERLLERGYEFRYPSLTLALEAISKQPRR